MSFAALVLAAVAVFAQQPPAPAPQAGQPAFRSGVQVVEVDARVFDRDRRFVAGLTRDDFEVLENGVPQPLQALYLVGDEGAAPASDAGLDPRAASDAAAGSSSGPQPAAPSRQTWIFLFDLNHLTPGSGFDRARTAVQEFLRARFHDGDVGGVVAGSKMVNNRLTSVREELVSAVKGIKPLGDGRSRLLDMTREWPRFTDAAEVLLAANENKDAIQRVIVRACSQDPDACRVVPPDQAVREKAKRLQRDFERSSLDTLRTINGLASGLAKIPGPKTIVFLSEGFVADEVATTLQGVVGQVARAGARVNAIDVRGFRGAGPDVGQMLADDPAGGPARIDLLADGPNSLAVDTGGIMIRNQNNIGRALEAIAADANRYYVLAYQPLNAVFDGKYRPIEVRVKRPGVVVRARRGYLALEPSKMVVRPGLGADARSAKAAGPEAGAPEPPRVTAAGTIVNTPSAPPSGTLRIRPNADDVIRELAGADAASAGGHAVKGWDAYQRGNVEDAEAAFRAAAAQPGVRPWVLYALGMSQAALGRPADAVASWERVRRAAPEFEAVYIDLADSYQQLGDLTRALEVLRDAAKRWPGDEEIHNAIGVIHVRRGALDDAIAAFDKAAAVADDTLAFFNLGRAYEMRYERSRRYVTSQRRWVASGGDREKAIENYRRYLQHGGPYASQATEALNRLEWSKSGR